MASPPPPPYPGFQPFVTAPTGYSQPQQNPGYPSKQAMAPGTYPVQQPVVAGGYPVQQPVVAGGYPVQQPVVAGAYPVQQPVVAGGYPVQQPVVAGGYPVQQPFIQPGFPPNQAGVTPHFVPAAPVHPQMFPNIPPQSQDDFGEEPKDMTSDWRGFTNKAIRAVFIRKVYAILMIQLAVSFGVVCLFVFQKDVKRFVQTHLWAYLLAYFIFIGVYIALACCGNLRRKYPQNVIMLSIFTLAQSYMLGVISSFHDTKAVVMAVGVCAAICLAVSLFSFHTKFDFTTCGGVLFILCWVLFFFGIIAIFTRHNLLQTVYAALGTLLFVAFLAYDTQMIMGGKKHELSAEEHIFAAICLYLDIVYIFMFILMAFGKK